MTIARNKSQLARALGIGVNAVYKWFHDGRPVPVEPDGTFDVEKVKAWRDEWYKDTRRTRGAEADVPKDQSISTWHKHASEIDRTAINELRHFKAKREELTYLRMKGSLIDKDEVDRLLVARAVEFKRELMSRARRLASRLQGRTVLEIQAELEEDARRMLSKYARADDDDGDADEAQPMGLGAEGSESPPETNGEPVG